MRRTGKPVGRFSPSHFLYYQESSTANKNQKWTILFFFKQLPCIAATTVEFDRFVAAKFPVQRRFFGKPIFGVPIGVTPSSAFRCDKSYGAAATEQQRPLFASFFSPHSYTTPATLTASLLLLSRSSSVGSRREERTLQGLLYRSFVAFYRSYRIYTFAPSRDVLFFASFALPVFVFFLLASFFARRVLCRSTEISRFPGCAKEKGNPTLLCTDLFLLSLHGRATYHSTGTEQLGWACWREYYYCYYYYYYYFYTHTHTICHTIYKWEHGIRLFFKRA